VQRHDFALPAGYYSEEEPLDGSLHSDLIALIENSIQSAVSVGDSMLKFTANLVVVDDSDEEFILVGFADEHGGVPRQSLHFQRSHHFDEQDVRLGLDSVYVERNGQGESGYGGVERVELSRHSVRVKIGGPVAEQLGEREFEIGLNLSSRKFQRLRNGLRLVFRGFDILTEDPASFDRHDS
jgi:hypothetical protein